MNESLAYNPISGIEYQGRNQAALGTGQWATFLQWKGAGYMVRKGQHGKQIVKFAEVANRDSKTGKTKGGIAHAVRVYTVFERGQVEQLKDPTCALCDEGTVHEH